MIGIEIILEKLPIIHDKFRNGNGNVLVNFRIFNKNGINNILDAVINANTRFLSFKAMYSINKITIK